MRVKVPFPLNLSPLQEVGMPASIPYRRQRIARLSIALLLLTAFGCSTSGKEKVDATSTANAVATLESATAQAREGATQAAQSTQEAAVKETASAVATVTAVAAAQGTATARVTSTAIALKTKDALERKAQAESTLAAKRTAMAAVSFKKTAQAESVADFIKQLVCQSRKTSKQ